jgi:hypothetical protein
VAQKYTRGSQPSTINVRLVTWLKVYRAQVAVPAAVPHDRTLHGEVVRRFNQGSFSQSISCYLGHWSQLVTGHSTVMTLEDVMGLGGCVLLGYVACGSEAMRVRDASEAWYPVDVCSVSAPLVVCLGWLRA